MMIRCIVAALALSIPMRYPLAQPLSCSRSLLLSLAILSCLLASTRDLSLSWLMHRSLERTNSRRCVVAAAALAFSILPPFSLSLYLRRSQRMEGVCIFFWWIVVGCRVAAASCGFLFSRLMMCFLCCWVMFSIGYQGKEFVWRCQSRKGMAKQTEMWLTSSIHQ